VKRNYKLCSEINKNARIIADAHIFWLRISCLVLIGPGRRSARYNFLIWRGECRSLKLLDSAHQDRGKKIRFTIFNLMISCGQPTKGSPPAWGLNEGLTSLAVKPTFYEMTHIILDLNHLERRKERRMDDSLTGNARSSCR
jgi:hypothetical protein